MLSTLLQNVDEHVTIDDDERSAAYLLQSITFTYPLCRSLGAPLICRVVGHAFMSAS